MLKDNVILPMHRRFKSGTEWEPIGFFSDSLCEAKSFDLMLGFFSSSAINILSDGFAAFLYNGGKMRMIINDILSQDDKDAIMAGEESTDLPFFDLHNLESIKHTLSERNRHFFECLSYLIRNDRLEIKVIAPKDEKGISHTKTGIFADGTNRIAFEGSCNFSKTALVDNIESFTVSCDWDGPTASANIEEIERDFDNTFHGYNESVKYEPIANIKTSIVANFHDKSLQQLVEDEFKQLQNEEDYSVLPGSIHKALRRAKRKVEMIILHEQEQNELKQAKAKPKFPYSNGPFQYQTDAYENWKANNQRGLFNMATGTGKTITALNCLLQIYKHSHYYKAIILVPTITLVEQWEQECRKFNFDNITKVYSKSTSWKTEVEGIKMIESISGTNNVSFVIISTYTSFVRQNVFDRLNSFDKDYGKLLLIADECHNMGSGKIRKRFKDIKYVRRIGLSATPDRQFDEDGTAEIKSFFGALAQYTFTYSMRQAIDDGRLCKYFYYPHIVSLTPQEFASYQDISEKIAKYYNPDKDELNSDPILTMLLIKRKRIIHKAVNKLSAFQTIVKDRFEKKGNLKYTLVYVPEGNVSDVDADYFINREDISDDDESMHIIDEYTRIISNIDKYVTVRKFTSDSKDRDNMLRDFANGKIQVLTSMKCLDEGVDVPRSELAIFCASTGNPRQFIQRRGRILRTHKDKQFAYIHDLVIAPKVEENSTNYKLERSMLRSELKRVSDFALLSENPSCAMMALKDVMDYYNLNLFENKK